MEPGRREHLIGSRVGQYVLEQPLGAGAMSLVYRARHAVNGSGAAIKLLHPHLASRRLYVQRIRREGEVGLRIRHENVLCILELGSSPEYGPFLVMEHVRGRTLQDILQMEGPFSPERAARIAQQIAIGLSAVHSGGYVHRDLKPGNLMLDGEPGHEHVKILDFGIVGFSSDDVLETQLTGDRWLLGTPSHMAPEQFDSTDVGPAADLYALGVVLFQMLTGHVPFTGPLASLIASHMTKAPPPLAELGGLGPLAFWLLSKAPQKRPASAVRVAQLIELMLPSLAGLPANAIEPIVTVMGRPTVTERAQQPEAIPERRRARAPAIAIYAAAAALGIGTGVVAHGFGLPETPAHAAELSRPRREELPPPITQLACPPTEPSKPDPAIDTALIPPSHEPEHGAIASSGAKPSTRRARSFGSSPASYEDLAELSRDLAAALDNAVEPALFNGGDI